MFTLESDIHKIYDGYIIPFTEGNIKIDESLLNEEAYKSANAIICSPNACITEQPKCYTIVTANGISKIVFFIAIKESTQRMLFLQMSNAFKLLKNDGIFNLSVLIGNVENIYSNQTIMQKIFESPKLVYYNFDAYLSKKAAKAPEVSYSFNKCQKELDLNNITNIAQIVSDGTLLARELVNRPADYMTPEQLAKSAALAGEEAGFVTEVFDKEQIEKIGMKSFLAVSAGSYNPPRLIVMRYSGGPQGSPLIALVGKGITFDSGGYSLKDKSGMVTMHTDMGGAAAVIGAMYSAAKQKLKLNLIGIVPACANLIGPNATLPGSVISSLLGRTTEVVSTDGEGRLILCDALTYAAKIENADILIDIATLTGGSSIAVGSKSAVVITEDERLFEYSKAASLSSCEKTWRLDMDEELRPVIKSFYADSKNSPSGPKYGGTIIASLFLKPFTLEKRWMHIDMAPVAWVTNDELPYVPKGATGYGVALLSSILQEMEADALC